MKKNMQKHGTLAACFSLLATSFIFIFPGYSEAIPAFARKYDVTCTVCHTKPPRLNPFGEAFHMAGYQIPMAGGGETVKKRKVGRVNMEKEFLNIFALRTHGNFLENYGSTKGGAESNIAMPQMVEMYFGGTITDDTSFFFTFEHEATEVEGKEDGTYESAPRFGIGKEFFLMFNLDSYAKALGHPRRGEKLTGKNHGTDKVISHGPMIMIGKIDPSTNFSYATNRQLILNLPGRVDDGAIKRFTIAPYAFASKFYGIRTGKGEVLEVTKSVLYNTGGDLGIDVHGIYGSFLYQVGVMQGTQAGFSDVNEGKDVYFVGRYNFGVENFTSGSVSGLVHKGTDTASVSKTSGSADRTLVDWLRYGFAANLKYKLLDIYGAYMWDKIEGLPQQTLAVFDDTASGLTVEVDYLVSSKLLLSGRYDQLNAGGFTAEKENGKLLTLQAKYYKQDNFSLYLRNSYNLKDESVNPLNNFQNALAIGFDLDF